MSFKLLKVSLCVFACSHILKHISHEEFERLNWLPKTYRFKQCVNSIVFKYFNDQCPSYLNEFFHITTESNFQLRGSFKKLNVSFLKLTTVNLLCLILIQLFETKPLTNSSIVAILIPSWRYDTKHDTFISP